MKVVVFTGGTGGTKLVQGLQQVVAPEDLTVIVNTGDDIEWWGLHVSPDIDSVLYGLVGAAQRRSRMGRGGRFVSLPGADEAARRAGVVQPGRSRSGDTSHAHFPAARRASLDRGDSRACRNAWASARACCPCRTIGFRPCWKPSKGPLSFQEYFVRERHQRRGSAGWSSSAPSSRRPAPGVLEAIAAADAIVFAPSNPVTSIGPILAVPGIRDALRTRRCAGGGGESDHRRRSGIGSSGGVDAHAGMAKHDRRHRESL